jgi:MOSC domain-containing protein YiiM
MKVLGVQVGRVETLDIGDRQVLSGIRKRPVSGEIAVAVLGLEGDEQADLTVHGGLRKAIYAYPVEHYGFWQEQRRGLGLSDDLAYGSLGENLTVEGLLEDSVYVGDTLLFPNCVLRVTQPRMPCYKFVATMGDRQAARKMMQTGFSGFYLAVDVPGRIAAGQSFELRHGPREMTLRALSR